MLAHFSPNHNEELFNKYLAELKSKFSVRVSTKLGKNKPAITFSMNVNRTALVHTLVKVMLLPSDTNNFILDANQYQNSNLIWEGGYVLESIDIVSGGQKVYPAKVSMFISWNLDPNENVLIKTWYHNLLAYETPKLPMVALKNKKIRFEIEDPTISIKDTQICCNLIFETKFKGEFNHITRFYDSTIDLIGSFQLNSVIQMNKPGYYHKLIICSTEPIEWISLKYKEFEMLNQVPICLLSNDTTNCEINLVHKPDYTISGIVVNESKTLNLDIKSIKNISDGRVTIYGVKLVKIDI